MRRLAVLGGVSMALVAAAACALSEDGSNAPHDEPEPSFRTPTCAKGGQQGRVRPTRGPECSLDGWCETSLPEPDLVVETSGHFGSGLRHRGELHPGIKVLEWTSADATWRYIDENGANEALADWPQGSGHRASMRSISSFRPAGSSTERAPSSRHGVGSGAAKRSPTTTPRRLTETRIKGA